jgi:hypothetical protein
MKDSTLSPSGTVYAVYDTYADSHQASAVANMLQGNHPEWHVRAALIGPGDRCVVQWAHRTV